MPARKPSAPSTHARILLVDDNVNGLKARKTVLEELGYKIETHQGAQFYCRSTTPIGSRLTQKQCLTVDTIVLTQKGAEQNNTMILQQQTCPKMGCGAK